MNDRELLEKAAKAAGIRYDAGMSVPHPKSGAFWGLWLMYDGEPSEYARRYWNPLTDDADALRLAVKLRIDVEFEGNKVVFADGNWSEFCEPDPYAATRRAITRAAAAMADVMEQEG